ncbi:MAG: NYN domain-containing protein, partial [Lachnospiraceae bacterium]|nr:NYN domain-containing protein [Lachnospiraceae bacterium]
LDKGPENEGWLGVDEIDAIIEKTAFSNRKNSIKNPYRKHRKNEEYTSQPAAKKSDKGNTKEKYLLVDGYNIIFAWDELKELAAASLDGARDRLNEIMSNYQSMNGHELIIVYDAYRVAGHREECLNLHNIKVIYTQEAETADRFIERFAHTKASLYDITVATSDGLEQIIIRGAGCKLMTARDLREDVDRYSSSLKERYMSAPFESAGTLIRDIIKNGDQ